MADLLIAFCNGTPPVKTRTEDVLFISGPVEMKRAAIEIEQTGTKRIYVNADAVAFLASPHRPKEDEE